MLRLGHGALEVLFTHHFPGRQISYPENHDERDKYELQLAAEIEYIQQVEINILARAIVKAFGGD